MNPFTKAQHTSEYKKILAQRKKLPVFAQMAEFYKMVRGSGFFALVERVCVIDMIERLVQYTSGYCYGR